jgi:hypothetical protein
MSLPKNLIEKYFTSTGEREKGGTITRKCKFRPAFLELYKKWTKWFIPFALFQTTPSLCTTTSTSNSVERSKWSTLK